jgi:hypothetical protein
MRIHTIRAPLCALAVLLSGFSCWAAGNAIDPDLRSPSLSDLLQREDDARARAAAKAEAAVPVVQDQAAPAAAAKPAKAVSGPVRQVYPSPYSAGAVTVLVPGGKLPAPPR